MLFRYHDNVSCLATNKIPHEWLVTALWLFWLQTIETILLLKEFFVSSYSSKATAEFKYKSVTLAGLLQSDLLTYSLSSVDPKGTWVTAHLFPSSSVLCCRLYLFQLYLKRNTVHASLSRFPGVLKVELLLRDLVLVVVLSYSRTCTVVSAWQRCHHLSFNN